MVACFFGQRTCLLDTAALELMRAALPDSHLPQQARRILGIILSIDEHSISLPATEESSFGVRNELLFDFLEGLQMDLSLGEEEADEVLASILPNCEYSESVEGIKTVYIEVSSLKR